MIVSIVPFTTSLRDSSAHRRLEERAPAHHNAAGFVEDDRCRVSEGELGAVHFWESEEVLEVQWPHPRRADQA